ncbi:MAG: hypothetical protein Kow0099_08700 [Candidatus Abyssubacteria bacterium]
MKDKTLLFSCGLAVLLHGIALLFNFGWQAATPIPAAASIEVTLIAPPVQASAAPPPGPPKTAAPAPGPPPVALASPKPPPPEPEPLPETPAPEPPPPPSPEPESVVAEEPDSSADGTSSLPETTAEGARQSGEFMEATVQPMEAAGLFGDEAEDTIAGDLASDVDVPIGYRYNPKPVYPRAARRRGEEGTVVLLVTVLANGRVAEIAIESSSGHAALDEAALKAVGRWRFEPAMRRGRPVTTRARIPVEFSLRE